MDRILFQEDVLWIHVDWTIIQYILLCMYTYSWWTFNYIFEIISRRLIHCNTRVLSQYKDSLSRYGNFHYKDRTVVIPSYLNNRYFHTCKTTFLYWDGPMAIMLMHIHLNDCFRDHFCKTALMWMLRGPHIRQGNIELSVNRAVLSKNLMSESMLTNFCDTTWRHHR